MTKFRIFGGSASAVESELNEWAASLPQGTSIRRTQLAAGVFGSLGTTLYVLVSYDEPPRET